jgi:hypothetical protein
MAEMTMCDRDCFKMLTCRRSPESGTATDGPFQSWFVDDPRTDPDKPADVYCLQYWPTENLED